MDMNNGILKVVRSLAAKKYRDDEGLFVAEGTKCVRDTWQHFNCRWLIAKRSWYEQCGTAEHYDKIVFANGQQMARISQFDTPSDVIAVYEKPVDTIDENLVASSLNIVLDNIQDPGNLGTMFRAAEGAGAAGIIMDRTTADVYAPKVIRSTMGSIFRVPFLITDDLAEPIAELKKAGTAVFAADLKGSISYDRADYTGGTAFLIGNEGNGLTGRAVALADQSIYIPMAGQLESLNAAVAASILMFEASRQRRGAK